MAKWKWVDDQEAILKGCESPEEGGGINEGVAHNLLKWK